MSADHLFSNFDFKFLDKEGEANSETETGALLGCNIQSAYIKIIHF